MKKFRKVLKGDVIKHKGWRRAAKITIIVFAVIALITMFLSPILKYLVEKYDVKYTGREITMSSAYINPFTGYFHFNNFRMYEQKSDSVFLYAKRVAVRFDLSKFLTKTYEIRSSNYVSPRQ